jgi:hypothetical protein
MKAGRVVGFIVLGIIAAGIAVSLPDIKRYIRITLM